MSKSKVPLTKQESSGSLNYSDTVNKLSFLLKNAAARMTLENVGAALVVEINSTLNEIDKHPSTHPQTISSLFLSRAEEEFKRHARENIVIEFIGGSFYAFGSELATLRLLAAYRYSEKIAQGYSDNRKSHFFRLEVMF